ncbi:MAG: hypothetical protein JSS60_04660 [Verrucomicrobia bacterium]|nr:hypothetical protein [Verrucomicrobiota bacterium]
MATKLDGVGPTLYPALQQLVGSGPVYPELHTFPTSFAPSYPVPVIKEPAVPAQLLEDTRNVWKDQPLPPLPNLFRTPSSYLAQYQAPVPQGQPLNLDKKSLEAINTYLNKIPNGFYPWSTDFNHPIHRQLIAICKPLLDSCHNWPLDKKIELCEKAVAEIVSSAALTPSQEYDGAMTSGMPILEYLAFKRGLTETLEIAARYHLFFGMCCQQRAQIGEVFHINQKFPCNLGERETALFQFVTKNDGYMRPVASLMGYMYDEAHLNSLVDSYVKKGRVALPLDAAIQHNEKLVAGALKELQLENHSHASLHFEFQVRDKLANQMIAKQAEQFKAQFEQTGTVTSEEVNSAADKIQRFQNGNGKLQLLVSPKVSLLIQIFGLPVSQVPFSSVRSHIEQQKAIDLQQAETTPLPPAPKGFTALFSRAPKVTVESRKQLIEEQVRKKVETLNWAEREWNEIMNPQPFDPRPMPSAPLPDDMSDLIPSDLAASQQEDLNPSLLHIVTDDRPEHVVKPQPISTTVSSPIQQPLAPVTTPVQLMGGQTLVVLSPQISTEPKRIQASDLDIPLVSYVNLAFENHLRTLDVTSTWRTLPEIVQKDVLRHTIKHADCRGKAEDLARAHFNTIPKLEEQFRALSKKTLPQVETGLSPEFVQKGESLLNYYYSEKALKDPFSFSQEFKKLPKEPRFYQYVYEMAKAAGVHIEPWDHHFAENNWDQIGMIPLSVQALERCLHTKP